MSAGVFAGSASVIFDVFLVKIQSTNAGLFIQRVLFSVFRKIERTFSNEITGD